MRFDDGHRSDRVDPPDRLFYFAATDWADGLTEDAARAEWLRARLDWEDQHGWPGGSLFRIRGERAARRHEPIGGPRTFAEAAQMYEEDE